MSKTVEPVTIQLKNLPRDLLEKAFREIQANKESGKKTGRKGA